MLLAAVAGVGGLLEAAAELVAAVEAGSPRNTGTQREPSRISRETCEQSVAKHR
jgi:hypothetical protein